MRTQPGALSEKNLEAWLERSASREIEALVLASSLDGRNGEAPPPDVFYFPQHQQIFKAIVAVESDGIPLTTLNVTRWLIDHDKIDQAGGPKALTDLSEHALPGPA